MDQNSESSGGVRTGVATYVVEAVVAALLLLLGITAVSYTHLTLPTSELV
mgnify:CR=1 FL=1